MNFLRIDIEFQSSLKIIAKKSLRHYSYVSRPIQITPWGFVSSNPRSLAAGEGQGRLGRPKSGKGAHQSLGESGGEAPRRREEPVGGFGWSGDGRWWLVGVTVAAAARTARRRGGSRGGLGAGLGLGAMRGQGGTR